MNLAPVFFGLALIAIVWFVVSTIRIYDFLRTRNVKVSFILLRLLIFSYVSQYKEITLKETGKVGPLFYHWVVSINIALVAVILGIISRTV
jgi:hypothetical protein